MVFQNGDPVQITYEGQTVNGEVFLACPTGLSLALRFDHSLGSYDKLMPVMWLNGKYVDLVGAKPVSLSSRARILKWPM